MKVMSKQWSLRAAATIALMVPLVSAYSFSLDLYIPLLPTIQSALEVSRSDMQLTNSLFMLCCGVGQLIFGPLSDRYGRRRILFLSIAFSLVANIICMNTMIYRWFLLGKALQALGACGAYLCCFATIRDLYHKPEKSAEMFSYLNIANSCSAIIAPSIGTQIGQRFGWPAIFVALALYALYAMVTCFFFFAETAPPRQTNNQQDSVLYDYWRVLTHVNYQVYTLPAALGVSSFFAFYSISPYLYQQTFGLSKVVYSILFGSCGLTFFIGSYVCSRLVKRLGIIETLIIGVAFHGIGCCGIIASFLMFTTLKLPIMHLSVMCMLWGSALMVSSGIGGTMAPFEDIAGSAFALISAYKFSLCYILGEIVIAFYDNTPVPMGMMLLGLNLFSSLILFIFRKKVVLDDDRPNPEAVAAEAMSQNIDNI